MDAFICVLVHLGWNGRLSLLGRGSCCDLISCESSRGMMSSSSDLELTTVRCRAPPLPPSPTTMSLFVISVFFFFACSSSSLTPYEFFFSLSQLLGWQKTSPCCLAQTSINSAFLSSCYFLSSACFSFSLLLSYFQGFPCQKIEVSIFEGQQFTSLNGQKKYDQCNSERGKLSTIN